MESEVRTAQPREREGSPEPSDADCQGEEGRCVEGHCAGGEAESGRSMSPIHASPCARAYRGLDVLVERPVVCPASKMPHSAAEIYPLKG